LDFIQGTEDVEIQRPARPVRLHVDESLVSNDDEYPITVTLRAGGATDFKDTSEGDHMDFSADSAVKCKYMIGCDGAHSWAREQLEIAMEGEQTE
jgi:phenol 2-monooxygenase